ncbi:MAG: putative Ig domain-containing protein [Nitrospiraceae bacterium]|nr:putative Ig domain-containing protein [Nitrospiraceae bacterium]
MIFFGSALGTQAAPVCPENITNYWMFDETGGTVFSDFVGSKNAGCAGDSCPGFIPGRINNALLFDGADDGIEVPADVSFDWGSTDSFSIEFWMNVESASTCSGGQVIVGRTDSSTKLRWWVGCQEGGQATFYLYGKDGAGISISGTTALTDGNWHHIVTVRDGIAGENRIYVDGMKENSASILYTEGFDSAVAGLNMGWLAFDSGHYHFSGAIDEVALYSVPLSAEEIWQHYANGLSGIGYCDSAVPYITSTAVTTAMAGQAYSYAVTATGNPAPTYSLTTFPTGMSINATTGLIEWTPSSGGSFNVTVQADNGIGTPATQSFTIQVNQTAAITTTPVMAALTGIPYQYDVDATGTPAPTFSLTASPSGMTINAATGLIQWTPASAGSFDVTVQADNGIGTPATQSFTIVVNQAPAITSTPVTTAIVGQAYSYTVTATGNPAPAYSLTVYPAGMTINAATGLIQWTPASAGSFDVIVQAGNLAGNAAQSFILSVADLTVIPHTNWSLKSVDSQERTCEDGAAVNSFDGNNATFWHTQWCGGNPPPPHEIQINLGASYSIGGFRYLPRQDGSANGRVGQYEFYVSSDGVNWGSAVAAGTFANTATEKEVRFTATAGRYVRLKALTEVNGNPWTSMAEINVLGQP